MNGALLREIASFGIIGIGCTVAYVALFAAARIWLSALTANILAQVLTALANTTFNRRFTFGVRGSSGLAYDHLSGLVAFLISLGLSTVALYVLAAIAPNANRAIEVVVLLVVNAVATAVRFGLLYVWFHHFHEYNQSVRVPVTDW
jgi:putative flippase GtrA